MVQYLLEDFDFKLVCDLGATTRVAFTFKVEVESEVARGRTSFEVVDGMVAEVEVVRFDFDFAEPDLLPRFFDPLELPLLARIPVRNTYNLLDGEYLPHASLVTPYHSTAPIHLSEPYQSQRLVMICLNY